MSRALGLLAGDEGAGGGEVRRKREATDRLREKARASRRAAVAGQIAQVEPGGRGERLPLGGIGHLDAHHREALRRQALQQAGDGGQRGFVAGEQVPAPGSGWEPPGPSRPTGSPGAASRAQVAPGQSPSWSTASMAMVPAAASTARTV